MVVKKKYRIYFYLLLLLPWIAALAITLEVYHGMRWRNIEKTNPYIRARKGEISWPVGAAPKYIPGEGGTSANKAQKTDSQTNAPELWTALREKRAQFFLTLDQAMRNRFAAMHKTRATILNQAGGIVSEYPVFTAQETPEAPKLPQPLTPHYNQPTAEFISQALPTLAQHPQGIWKELSQPTQEIPLTQIFLYPASAQTLVFVWNRAADSAYLNQENMWDIPYFIYKPYASRKEQPFHTNNLGFRDRDVILPKPPHVYRILCIGGSTTEEGDTNEATYPKLVEKNLQKALGNKALEVFNCGISGIGSHAETMRVPDYLFQDADLVVYYNGVNDLCYSVLPSMLENSTWEQRMLQRSRFLNFHANRFLLPNKKKTLEILEERCFSNFHFIAKHIQDSGIPIAFCSFAHPTEDQLSSAERAYYDYYFMKEWGGKNTTFSTYLYLLELFNQQLKQFCIDNKAHYIPTAENISGGALYFGDICHMRNEGIEKKAACVSQYILDNFKEDILEKMGSGLAKDQIATGEKIEDQPAQNPANGSHLGISLQNRPAVK